MKKIIMKNVTTLYGSPFTIIIMSPSNWLVTVWQALTILKII